MNWAVPMGEIYLVPGLRTPFVKAGGAYTRFSSLQLSIPVVQAMRNRARPDLLIWGQVIPDPSIPNIARELVFEAGLEATVPAYSTVMACSSSFTVALQAAGCARCTSKRSCAVRPCRRQPWDQALPAATATLSPSRTEPKYSVTA